MRYFFALIVNEITCKYSGFKDRYVLVLEVSKFALENHGLHS